MKSIKEKQVPEPMEAVTLEAWRRLYEVAGKVRELEPWRWMEETDIFGVQDPEGDEVAFVSIMGLLGEYHAVALYLGPGALAQFWQMQEATAGEQVADIMMGVPQLHAAFGKKRELDRKEKEVVQRLGLSCKGADAWPRFLSFRPGWAPWIVEAREARLLTLVLEQLLQVAPRVQQDRRLLLAMADDDYLVRRAGGADSAGGWTDTHRTFPPAAVTMRVTVPNALMDAVRQLEPSGNTVEIDVYPMSTPIGEKGERPQVPYGLMAVDAESGFVLGVELVTVETTLEALWTEIPAKFLSMVQKAGIRPRTIAVRNPSLFMVMDHMCRELEIEIKPDSVLPALTHVRHDLDGFFRR